MESEKGQLNQLINQISEIKTMHNEMNSIEQKDNLAKKVQEAINTIDGLIYHGFRPSPLKWIFRRFNPFVSHRELVVCRAIEMQSILNKSKEMIEQGPNYSVPYPTDLMSELAFLELKDRLYRTLTPVLDSFLILNRQYFYIGY